MFFHTASVPPNRGISTSSPRCSTSLPPRSRNTVTGRGAASATAASASTRPEAASNDLDMRVRRATTMPVPSSWRATRNRRDHLPLPQSGCGICMLVGRPRTSYSHTVSFRSRIKELVFDRVPGLIRRGPSATKRVAITFDDGPDDMTPAYLDLMDELKIPATFFLI